MKPNYILLILLCTCLSAKAQIVVKLYEDTAYIHKLQEHYAVAENDSTKAYAAFRLAYAYKRAKDLPKANEYLEKGISLSGNSSFLKGASLYYQAYVMMGDPDLQKIRNYAAQADSLLSFSAHTEAYRLRSNNWVLQGVLEQLR